MEWIETTGISLDEAKERALDRLGVAEDELEVEVLVEASRSMFGLKKTEARLRARVRPNNPRPKVERRDRNRRNDRNGGRGRNGSSKGGSRQNGNSKKTDEDKGRGSAEGRGDRQQSRGDVRKGDRPNNSGRGRQQGAKKQVQPVGTTSEDNASGSAEKRGGGRSRSGDSAKASIKRNGRESGRERADVETMDLQTQAQITEDFVQGLLDRMGLEARVASRIEEDRLTVEAQGLNLGLAIGQRGETVRAITELSRTLVQRSSDGQAEGSMTVDIGGYRERRRTFLADFARTQGEAVLGDGRPRALEPMGAADRKVVHDTVGEIDGLSTASEGSDADRRVVISLIED
ncbi:MAG: Jag N-terminal domain-containing protein [Acidimicrobiales bacterium]|nr:Jag N-terminal domain-containing protein [Acidimicrobiales bacterium]